MKRQRSLTVIAKIKPDKAQSLNRLLTEYGTYQGMISDSETLFKKIPSVHFARWVLIPTDTLLNLPPSLSLTTNFDGETDDHLNEIASIVFKELDEVYAHCEGYPERPTLESRKAFLKKRLHYTDTFYVGTRGRTVDQIKKENALHEKLRDFLDENIVAFKNNTPVQVAAALKKHISETTDLQWANKPLETFSLRQSVMNVLKFIPAFVAVLIGTVLTLITLPILRYYEITNIPENKRIDRERNRVLEEREDLSLQNQLTNITYVQPGLYRLFVLKFALFAINFVAEYFQNKGKLGGIPSIHFARWVAIDGGKRLLFFSNFDGQWETYLGDFIDKASYGLTAVWSNTSGFPKTQFLAFKGALDELNFKNYARYHQIPTQVWYTAYPGITVKNINNNTKIREYLSREKLNEKQAQELLQLI